ncbi:putative exosome complex component RRP4 [Apostichopus japonicus]|uniref:Putative exosome complex component RRP4 n=1 Tax=Stichopus japonicus TaxID=307972 RepID=A0A2G8LAK0_STIJA|nr:putative exosome complex component RRP4 [Apostichopus japonicus]
MLGIVCVFWFLSLTLLTAIFIFLSLLHSKPVPMEDREVIVRLRNCILGLASQNVMLFDTCILYTYESSMRYTIPELLVPEKMENVVEWTLQRLEQEGAV